MTSLNSAPTSERVQIGIFGKVNAGKSSVLNALTGQEMAVVSAQEGTTTDPVKKAMELLPVGPVMLYDTPGLADESTLGAKRQQKTAEILRRIDMGLVVVDASDKQSRTALALERDLIREFQQRQLPYLVIANKMDRIANADGVGLRLAGLLDIEPDDIFPFSCRKDWPEGYTDPLPQKVEGEVNQKGAVFQLREKIAQLGRRKQAEKKRYLVSDLIEKGDVVLLVIPIDESAPKGRLILPQQQVIRDILDSGAVAMAVQPSELTQALEQLQRAPKLVITDSQAFGQVSGLLPEEIPLTSFSILMARYKGDLGWQAAGAKTIDHMEAGARILISEGCTHHRQCGDIGTVKLPGWIQEYTGKEFDYHFTSGGEFPGYEEMDYDLIIHCGGCTLPPQEMAWRLSQAKAAGTAMTNYGTMIAYLHGILERAMEPLKNNFGEQL